MNLTRRTFTKYAASSSVVGGTSGAVSLVSPPTRAAYSAEQINDAMTKMRGRSMVFVSWGGLQQDALRKAWLQPFAAKYGVKILEDGPPLNPKIVAMVRSGKPIWDICDLSPYRLMSLGAAGCLE